MDTLITFGIPISILGLLYIVLRRYIALDSYLFIMIALIMTVRETGIWAMARNLVWDNRSSEEFCNGVRAYHDIISGSGLIFYLGMLGLSILYFLRTRKSRRSQLSRRQVTPSPRSKSEAHVG